MFDARRFMKQFLVFMTDLALAPLKGQNPRGGYTEDFDSLSAASGYAEKEKGNWDRVFVFQRHDNGELERLEHYQKSINEPGRAQKYVGNKRQK
jgi:hypothetical protein